MAENRVGYPPEYREHRIDRAALQRPRSSGLLHPLGRNDRTHIRHHQPQKLTVRASGADPEPPSRCRVCRCGDGE